MSCLYRRKGNPKYVQWTAYYQGEKLRKSTGQMDMEEAKRVQAQWDEQLRYDDTSFLGFKLSAPTSIEEYINDHVSLLKGVISTNNYHNTKSELYRLRVFLHSMKITNIREITPRIMKYYLLEKINSGKSPKTIKNHFGFISILFDSAVDDDIIHKNPVKKIKKPKIKENKPHRELEQIDLDIIINNESEYQLYYQFLLYTGLRAGDAALLKYGQIGYYGEIPIINVYIKKSDTFTTLPLSNVLLKKLDLNKQTDEPIFPNLYDENPIRLNWKYTKARIYLQELLKKKNRPKATLHSFRVTFNNVLRNLGLSIEDRQVLMAHSASKVTKDYTRTNVPLSAEMINKIPDYSKVKESTVYYGVYYNYEYNYV